MVCAPPALVVMVILPLGKIAIRSCFVQLVQSQQEQTALRRNAA
jgi:hypothetical protein